MSPGPTIGLNLLFLAPGETGGMEVHVRGLLPELVHAWPDARFVAFCGRELAGERWEGVETVVLPVSARTRWARTAGEQTLLPRAARRTRVDLLHSPANTMPAWSPGRTVTTIHDVIHARFPETHAGVLGRGLAALVKLSVRRADRLIAISEATKRDVIDTLRVPDERIDVVHNGFGAIDRGTPTPEPALRERFGLGDPTGPHAIDHLLARGLEVEERPHRLDAAERELTEPDGRRIRLSDHAPVAARFGMP